jgi:hypothetical protein
MGGTDTFDQRVSYYKTIVKEKKWQWSIFSHMFSAAMTNAYILYCIEHNKNSKQYPLIEFIFDVCEAWRTSISPEEQKRNTKYVKKQPEFRNLGRHTPHLLHNIRLEDGKRQEFRRICKECGSRINCMCIECDVELCLLSSTNNLFDESCWHKWHYQN